MANRKVYAILTYIWLFLWGVLAVTSFTFALANPIMGFLAILAAVAWAFDK